MTKNYKPSYPVKPLPYKIDNVISCIEYEKLSLSEVLEKIKSSFPRTNYNNIFLELHRIDEYGERGEITLEFHEQKSQEQFDKEMEVYKECVRKYQEDLKEYNKKQIEELQEEIERLK